MVGKSNTHWILTHEDELRDLPDTTFKYNEVDIPFSLFREAAEREVLHKTGEQDGVHIWKVDRRKLEEVLATELEKSAQGGDE
jgi:hypothetical protein